MNWMNFSFFFRSEGGGQVTPPRTLKLAFYTTKRVTEILQRASMSPRV